ncbi:MAG: thioredoxin domain-containing protein [bacterium]|nr:thioredoxin domain-containing protein [bacterium]
MERAGTNRLAAEKSPYLLQHASNPVDWYPWGDEAFEAARRERKPLFISIGYSTCHWCHVMERESFSDAEVAAALRDGFIAVKVDREERPDVDRVYMEACLAMTGGGGWPLTVLATPSGEPFFAGTYFPKRSRRGLPGLLDLLAAARDRWREDPAAIERAAAGILARLRETAARPAPGDPPGRETADRAAGELRSRFDRAHGGFGGAPKFPSAHLLTFLLRHARAAPADDGMVRTTLDAMARGGIFDQLGFGFHRYATDERWLVPHFEKMLYDQAMLAIAYTEARQATGDPAWEAVARRTIEYVRRDMTAPGGAFFSAEDADSEGEEGRFYVWTPAEIEEVLGVERGRLASRFFGVTPAGNFEGGRSVLHVPVPPDEFARREGIDRAALDRTIEECRRLLLAARGRRVRPHRDDKILADWNGLMIAALAKAAASFDEPAYAEAAARAARFILDRMRAADGTLLHRYRDGEAAIPGFLDDHAFLAWGLLELYGATFRPEWLREALDLADRMRRRFRAPGGGLAFTAAGAEPLILRPADAHDGAHPSGQSVAAAVLFRLGRMTGREELEEAAADCLRALSGAATASPAGHAHLMSAVLDALRPGPEIVIAGDPRRADTGRLVRAARAPFMPGAAILLHPGGRAGAELERLAPFVKGMGTVDGAAAAYVCEAYACALPVTDADALARMLGSSGRR